MDEYLGYITLTLIGRMRPYSCTLQLNQHMDYDETNEEKFAAEFIRACNSAEFREYYFREDRIALKYIVNITYLILNANQDVFRHIVYVYPKEKLADVRIECYYQICEDVIHDHEMHIVEESECNDECVKVFQYRFIVFKYTQISTGRIFCNAVRDYKCDNIFILLQERGFTICIGDNGDIRAKLNLANKN